MKKIARVSSDLRSNLVAYLDGELDEQHSHNVELLLAQSEVARHDVEMLSRSFDLLDLLPQDKASETFTQNTMTTIATLDNSIPVTQQSWFSWVRNGGIVFGWIVLISAVALGGYSAGSRLWPTETEQVIKQLPLLENLHLYEEIEEVEFLERLLQKRMLEPLKGNYEQEKSEDEQGGAQ